MMAAHRRATGVVSCVFAMATPAMAQVSPSDATVRPAYATYLVESSLVLAHVTSVDETLSPERYGGGGHAAGIRVARLGERWRVAVESGFNVSSGLTSTRTAGGLPRVRFVAIEGRVDLQRRLVRIRPGGATVLVGGAIDGRYAERTHYLGAPAGASSSIPENSGEDYVVAVQPTIEVAHSLGSWAIASRLGVGAIAAVWHHWAPIGSINAPAKVQAPPSLMQIDNALTVRRPMGRHAMIGVAYRLRLLRARSPLLLAESRHDVAVTLGWRRGRRE